MAVQTEKNAVSQLIKKLANDKCLFYTALNKDMPKGGVILLGDSLVDNFPIYEMYHGDKNIYNRGVASNTTYDVLERLEATVLTLEPSKVFIIVGTNDFLPFVPNNNEVEIAGRIGEIARRIKNSNEKVRIYIQSIYPINCSDHPKIFKDWQLNKNNNKIKTLNDEIKQICKNSGYFYIDIYSHLLDEKEELDIELTIDGTHVNYKAYQIIFNILEKYF